MLSDFTSTYIHSGSLHQALHLPNTSLFEILDFIKNQLPIWRDRTDREHETAEDRLTSQLCFHLNSAARQHMDFIQFQHQTPDEQKKNRTLDLTASPSGQSIVIEGHRYTDFDTLMPIECKRLPTPKDHNREECEYVVTVTPKRLTGGIQRFKEGHHGANHNIAGMIAYIQDNTRLFWHNQVKWTPLSRQKREKNKVETDVVL